MIISHCRRHLANRLQRVPLLPAAAVTVYLLTVSYTIIFLRSHCPQERGTHVMNGKDVLLTHRTERPQNTETMHDTIRGDVHPTQQKNTIYASVTGVKNTDCGTSLNCEMETCFNSYSCPLDSGFPAYFYSSDENLLVNSSMLEMVRRQDSTWYLTYDMREACVFVVLMQESLVRSISPDKLQASIHSLPYWMHDGSNHVLIYLTDTGHITDNFNINTGKAIVAHTVFSKSRFRYSYDVIISPSIGARSGLALRPLSPCRRRFLVSFWGEFLQPLLTESQELYRTRQNLVVSMVENMTGLTEMEWEVNLNVSCGLSSAVGSSTEWGLCGDTKQRKAILSQSTFALIISPFDNSLATTSAFQTRLYEALICGAVPVILGVSDRYLPFSEWLDWKSAVFVLPLARIIDLGWILPSITDSDVFYLRQQGRHMFETFFSSAQRVVDTAMAVLKARLRIPFNPAKEENAISVFSDSIPWLATGAEEENRKRTHRGQGQVQQGQRPWHQQENQQGYQDKKIHQEGQAHQLGHDKQKGQHQHQNKHGQQTGQHQQLHLEGNQKHDQQHGSHHKRRLHQDQQSEGKFQEKNTPSTQSSRGLGLPATRFPSLKFQRNFTQTLVAQQSSRLRGDPFSLFSFMPFDPVLPGEVRFWGHSFKLTANGTVDGSPDSRFSPLLGGNSPAEYFTAVIVTYKREKALVTSLQRLEGLPFLHKVVVIWNDPVPPTSGLHWPNLGVPLEVLKTGFNSMNNRYLPCDVIETEAVFSLDDDVELSHQSILFAFRVWRGERDRIVGVQSRVHNWDNQRQMWTFSDLPLNRRGQGAPEISIVIPSVSFMHKYYFHMYSQVMPAAVREHVDNVLNCEDIAMNFLVAHITRKPPIVVSVPWKRNCLDCKEALSARLNSLRTRCHCLKQFATIYGYMPLLFTPYVIHPLLPLA